jgi:hypothetical protein
MAPSPTTSGLAAAASSSSATKTITVGSNLKVRAERKYPNPLLANNVQIVGIILAIVSGLLIGSSFVFKKKGLLRSQAGGPAGEGVAYLKSVRIAANFMSRTNY